MRSVSSRLRRGGALLLLLVALAVPSAYATDGFPYEPPAGRGRPPIGVTSTGEAEDPGFFAWLLDWVMELQGRARPPIG